MTKFDSSPGIAIINAVAVGGSPSTMSSVQALRGWLVPVACVVYICSRSGQKVSRNSALPDVIHFLK